MTNEAARHLMELPKYTAYAKAKNRARIKTRRLPKEERKIAQIVWDIITTGYYENRAEIEERAKERQEKWKEYIMPADREPPTPYNYSEMEGAVARSPQAPVVERDGPPPVSHRW